MNEVQPIPLSDSGSEPTPEQVPAQQTPARSPRVRAFRFVLLGVGLVLAFLVSRTMPHDQVIRFNLGRTSGVVEELRVRYGESRESQKDARDSWEREVTFRYPQGAAPRIVEHEVRLANGEYDVEIDVISAEQTSTMKRHVNLLGKPTSIDVSEAVRK